MSKSYVPLVLIGGTIMNTNIFETKMNVEAIDNMYDMINSYGSLAEAVNDSMYMDMLEQFDEEVSELIIELRKSIKTGTIDKDDYDEALIELKKIIKVYFIERIIEKAIEHHDYNIISAAEEYLSSLGIRSRKAENSEPFDSSIMTVEYIEATTDNSKHKTVKDMTCPMYYYETSGKTKIINKIKTIVYKYEA